MVHASERPIRGHDTRNNIFAVILAVAIFGAGAVLSTFDATIIRAVGVVLIVVSAYSLGLWFLWPYRGKKMATTLLIAAFCFVALAVVSAIGWWLFLPTQEQMAKAAGGAYAENGHTYVNLGPIKWIRELTIPTDSMEGGIQHNVASITITGWNISTQEVHFTDAYILSGITGEKIVMQFGGWGNGKGPYFPLNTLNPIPSQAVITLQAILPKAMPEAQCRGLWDKFSFVAEYNGASYRINFDERDLDFGFAKWRHRSPATPRVTTSPPVAIRAEGVKGLHMEGNVSIGMPLADIKNSSDVTAKDNTTIMPKK